MVGGAAAASVCTGERFLPFGNEECKLCARALLSVSPLRLLQSADTLPVPVLAPLGTLAPLRGPAALPAGILRVPLASDVGISADPGRAAEAGTQVRLCLFWARALERPRCGRSQAWCCLKA